MIRRVVLPGAAPDIAEALRQVLGGAHQNDIISARRAELIEHLCAMPPIKPALDGIIEHYGTDKVAEVTGRTKRLITQADGNQRLETRSPRTNQSETDQFMDGQIGRAHV